ncbi:PWWP domain-containing protein MUM1 [Alligator mississippiensis]|uniref:PWWP domain-containing protein MUM1 n=1 Tax=Alligator mississippiensis TaxID=8496 RepID=A0A151PFI7_ALLMI|nr:PWWP domain-containing protein MUM1 [Alligator mississippiensis]
MTDPEYVLCRWKKRLWPAKVLSKIVTSTRSGKTASFNVEILGVAEQTKITCADPEPLEKERIQVIASELGDREEKPTDELEEIKYRCALRIALNILNGEASSKQKLITYTRGECKNQGGKKKVKKVLPQRMLLEKRLVGKNGLEGDYWILLWNLYQMNCKVKKRLDLSPRPREKKNKSNLRAKNIELPDFQEDEELEASDLSSKLSSSENSHLVSYLVDEEEDEELPSFLLHQEPSSIEPGMLVWCKLRRYPYWPAVVKRVSRKPKKANVLLIEGNVNVKNPKGFSTHLRNLKHFDCEEKQKLIDQAKEDYSHEVEWCIELISDYRIRVGCHSFTGSFLEYLADDISYPVRKEVKQGIVQMTFPHVPEEDLEESVLETPSDKPSKKVLPDRMRAARDKANEKIVEFIVKTKGAEEHLQAILKSQKQSRWLKEFLNSSHYVTCVETYLEDEGQLELVVNYLKKVYHETDARNLDLVNGDRIKFILDVLLPEAVIFAISAVDDIDYKKAEEKYIKGPSVSKREREIFDEEILERKKLELLDTKLASEDSI